MKRVLFITAALLLCLLAALLAGCASQGAPIRLTPLGEAETAAPEDGGARVSIRTERGAAVPAAIPTPEPTPAPGESAPRLYVLNTNSKRFHLPECESVRDMKPSNRRDVTAARDELLEQGYIPCGRCKP